MALILVQRQWSTLYSRLPLCSVLACRRNRVHRRAFHTRSSSAAAGRRTARRASQLKFCPLLHNCRNKVYNKFVINRSKMELQHYGRRACSIHRESKKQDTKLLAITSLIIIGFSKFFTSRLCSKFATNLCLNIPPRFKHVATLPCEI